MAALTAARFGLHNQEHAPFDDKSGTGYLAISHEQNLNAWFAEDGITVRPTVQAEERVQAWQVTFRLKAYGYGSELITPPPVVSRHVNGTRIEYGRRSEVGSHKSEPQLTEWYDNRPEGIEQGFTLNERPKRTRAESADEPLRVLLAVSGDLHAELKDGGWVIELVNKTGKGTLSYGQLTAKDADGKQIVARMEASKDGREIALLMDDEAARYPIVIDPVVASLEMKLASSTSELDARFGTALAIDGDRAVVGAWRDDFSSLADAGAIYVFTRSGTT